jgi:serine/threonine protein kinase
MNGVSRGGCCDRHSRSQATALPRIARLPAKWIVSGYPYPFLFNPAPPHGTIVRQFMPLAAGNWMGPYEVLASLGAGGMLEVYRATDTKLGRGISLGMALKVPPSEMAQDPERLAPFRRETKGFVQLDHPNIVTIHSVEESDGIHFLTMQLGRQKAEAIEAFDEELMKLGGKPVGAPASRKKLRCWQPE